MLYPGLGDYLKHSAGVNRRALLAAIAGAGIGTAAFQRSLAAQAEQAGEVTTAMIKEAEWVAGIELSDEEREAVASAVERDQRALAALRKVPLGNSVPPAMAFFAAPPQDGNGDSRGEVRPIETAAPDRPSKDDDLAFLPVSELAALVRSRKVSSVELTRLYLDRLQRYN